MSNIVSLTLREEHNVRVLGNRLLRKIVGPERHSS